MSNPIYETGARPVNRMAKDVIGGGEHYAHEPKGESNVDQPQAYPTRAVAEIPIHLRHLRGYRYGRLTVIGMALVPSRWVVRCSCGTYSLRSTKAIKNPKNNLDACKSCQHQMYLQRKSVFVRTGRDVDLADLPGASPNKPPLPPPVTTGICKSRSLAPRDLTTRPAPQPSDPVHHTQRLAQIPTSMQAAMEDAIAAMTRKPSKR